MTLFSRSPAIQEINRQAKARAAEGLYEPSQRRLRVPLSMVVNMLLGNVTTEVYGEEHLLKAAEKTKSNEEDKDFKTDYCQNIFENKEKSNKENKYKVQTKSFDTEKSKPVEKVRDEGFVHETDSVKLPRKQRKVYSEEEAEAIIEDMRDFISKLFEKMEINVNMDTEFNHRDNEISVFFSSDEDIGLIIGKRGQTLDAIQYIVSLVVNKNTESYIRIKMDTENYRERRKENLEVLAKNVASKVKKFKKPISLEPMNPYERRIIHSVLQSDNFVSTRSDGDEPFRYITVIPRYNKRNNYRKYNNNLNK